MNDLMSLGIHRCWKDEFINTLGYIKAQKVMKDNQISFVPAKVLDVAGGTGDIAFKILENNKKKQQHLGQNDLQITVFDIN